MKLSFIAGIRQFGSRILSHSERKRRRTGIAKIVESGLFDREWYLNSYRDVRASGVDPVRHYLEIGWKEGLDPGPAFSSNGYLRTNADVAAMGMNPLLHYIEHGQSEGRGVPGRGAARGPSVDLLSTFGPAAPCLAVPLEDRPTCPWARAGQIAAPAATGLLIDGVIVARAPDAGAAIRGEPSIRRLAWLSGWGDSPEEDIPTSSGIAPRLKDGWFAGRGILRLRWAAFRSQAVVVRAVQQAGPEPRLVGEALILDELDVLDVHVENALAPLLFIFTSEDGALLGYRLLVFPSLCRGGLHYPELIALAAQADSDPDLCEVDARLAESLTNLRRGAAPLIQTLSASLHDADGASPIFQRDVRAWLSRVMGVGIEAESAPETPAGRYLAEAVTLRPEGWRHGGTARLAVSSTMHPTISALVAGGGATDDDRGSIASLIVASADPARPFTLVRAPLVPLPAAFVAVARIFPRISGGGTRDGALPAAAIQAAPRRKLDDAELLVPDSSVREQELERRSSVSWLIRPSEWQGDRLREALWSLTMQSAGPQHVLFVGAAPEDFGSAARRWFEGRVRTEASLEAACAAAPSDLIGYLGGGVVLHHRSCITLLAGLLEADGVASASAPLVTAQERGRDWHIALAEAGPDLRSTWNPAVPVAQPPSAFWMTRRSTLEDWIGMSSGAAGGIHLRSTLTSATSLQPRSHRPLIVPPENRQGAVALETLVG